MWFQLTLMLVGAVRIGHTCGVYTYNHDNRCCDMCPPGTHVGQHCDERTVTVCVTCEQNTFERNWNNETKCKPCRQESCEGPRTLIHLCSPREDNQCRCNIENTYWDDNVVSCIPCPSCSQGEYPKAPCTGDPQCTKCPDNHFSDKEENFNLTCTKCTTCFKYERKCSSMQNSVCVDVAEHETTTETPPKTTTLEPAIETTKKKRNDSKNNDAPASALNKNHYWIIAVFSLLVCILFFGAAVYYRKNKNRCQPRRGPGRFFAIQPSRYRQLNTGLLLRDQSAGFQFRLHDLLNPNGPRNWKALAAVLNFTPNEIANFAVQRDKSAEDMLDSWKTANVATVDRLYDALLSIGREDVAEFVYTSMCEQETDV